MNLYRNTGYFFCCFFLFCWIKVHFVDPLIAPMLDIVWPCPWVSKTGWFSCLHTSLLGEPNGYTGATPTFPLGGVFSMCSRHPSYKQRNGGYRYKGSVMLGWSPKIWQLLALTVCSIDIASPHHTPRHVCLHFYSSSLYYT